MKIISKLIENYKGKKLNSKKIYIKYYLKFKKI